MKSITSQIVILVNDFEMRVFSFHHIILLFLVSVLSAECGVRNGNCDIAGEWTIEIGGLNEKFGAPSSYRSDRVIFRRDTIYLASGFFYNIIGPNDDYPYGRYPFVFYGNKEIYRVAGDSLFIFSQPYSEWTSFHISCAGTDKLILTSSHNSEKIVLKRSKNTSDSKTCKIVSITANVQTGTLDEFNVNYSVRFSNDDLMLYESNDSAAGNHLKQSFQLEAGTFSDICSGFGRVDFAKLKSIYPATVSDFKPVKIEFIMADGVKVEVMIQDMASDEAPEELRLALVPILFYYQRFIHPGLPAKRFTED